MITGLIVGLAMFFEVGFVLLLPLVFTIVASSGLPLLYVGVPMVAALSVTHCFLPPHPGPTAIATIFEANLGTTLLYGLIITIPTVIVAGPLFSNCWRALRKRRLKDYLILTYSVKRRCRHSGTVFLPP